MPGKEECFFFPDLKAGEEIEFEFQVHRCLIIPFFLEYKMSDYRCLIIPFPLEHNPFKCSFSWTFKWGWKCLSILSDRFLISHLKVQEEEHVLYCREKIRLENTWKHSGDWDKCSDGQWRDWCAGVLTWLLWFSGYYYMMLNIFHSKSILNS